MSDNHPMSDDDLWNSSARPGQYSPVDLGIDSDAMNSPIISLNEGTSVLLHCLLSNPTSDDGKEEK